MTGPAAIDPQVQRLLAGELARSLWKTASPQAVPSGDDGDPDATPVASAADTYGSLFTDVLADALAAR